MEIIFCWNTNFQKFCLFYQNVSLPATKPKQKTQRNTILFWWGFFIFRKFNLFRIMRKRFKRATRLSVFWYSFVRTVLSIVRSLWTVSYQFLFFEFVTQFSPDTSELFLPYSQKQDDICWLNWYSKWLLKFVIIRTKMKEVCCVCVCVSLPCNSRNRVK